MEDDADALIVHGETNSKTLQRTRNAKNELKGDALDGEPSEMDDNGHPWPKDGRFGRSGGRWGGQLLPRDCTQCGKQFPTHTKLKYHVKMVHDKIKDVFCDECDKAFGCKALLNQHKIRVHSTTRPYKCNICYKGHVTKAELVLHMGVHTGEKPWAKHSQDFICGECGKTFGKKNDFEDHMKWHETGFVHRCEQCDKTFSYKKGLQGHIKYAHSGPEERAKFRAARNKKPWERIRERKKEDFGTTCHECGATFDKISSLKRHLASHVLPHRSTVNTSNYVVQSGTGKKVMCADCGKEFASAKGLKEHVLMIHMEYYPKTPTSDVKADIKEKALAEKRKMVVPHSESQMQLLKDIMEEFGGRELTYVLDYVKSLKENGDEEFVEGIIKNQRDGCYRPILMELGVIEAITMSSSLGENIEVEVDVKIEAESDTSDEDEEVPFGEELELAEDLAEYEDDWSGNEDSKTGFDPQPEVNCKITSRKLLGDCTGAMETIKSDMEVKGENMDVSQLKPKYKKKKKDSSLIESRDCPQCGITMKVTWLRTHMATHLYTTLNVMEKIEVSEDGTKTECMDCGKEFKQTKNAKEHVVVTHFTEVLNKALEGCSEVDGLIEGKPSSQRTQKTRELFNSLNVSEQIKKSADGKSGTCLICGKEFAKARYIKDHIIKIHYGIDKYEGDETQKPIHVCEECGAEFPDSSRLKKHAMTHTGLKPYPCPECGKCFTAPGSVKQHLLIVHEGIKDFSCDQCGEKFARKPSLKAHVQMKHTDEKRERTWFCDYTGCGRAFYNKGGLDRHALTHSTEKPYKCDQCDKSFAQNTILVEHMRVHTGEKPFTCHLCGTAFRQTSTLRAHLINVHHEQPEATRGAHLLVPRETSEEKDNKGKPVNYKEEGGGHLGQDDKQDVENQPLVSPSKNISKQTLQTNSNQTSHSTDNQFYPATVGGSTDTLHKLYRGLIGQGMPGEKPPTMEAQMPGTMPTLIADAIPNAAYHDLRRANEIRVKAGDLGVQKSAYNLYREEVEPNRGYWDQQGIKSQYTNHHMNHLSPTLGHQSPDSGEGRGAVGGGNEVNLHSIYGRDGKEEERGPWSMGAMGQAHRTENLSPYPAQP